MERGWYDGGVVFVSLGQRCDRGWENGDVGCYGAVFGRELCLVGRGVRSLVWVFIKGVSLLVPGGRSLMLCDGKM